MYLNGECLCVFTSDLTAHCRALACVSLQYKTVFPAGLLNGACMSAFVFLVFKGFDVC